MKLNCPACGEPFEDETDLGVTLKLVEHLRSLPETEHIAQLAAMLKELERLIAQDESGTMAAVSLDIRQEIFDRCARFDERLRTVQLLAVSTLTVAIDQIREILQECSDRQMQIQRPASLSPNRAICLIRSRDGCTVRIRKKRARGRASCHERV